MNNAFERRKKETREMIIEASRKSFSTKGYYKTQIKDIVDDIGMSAGTIYTHFKDKRDLFEQLSKDNLETLRITLKKLRQPSRPGDLIERLGRWRETYNAFFDYIDENPQQVLMILRSGFGIDEKLDIDIWNYFTIFARDLAEDFKKWKDLGYIEGLNTMLLGHIVVGMCLHVAHYYLMDNDFTRKEAIETLIALNQSMFSHYLTDKGRSALWDLASLQKEPPETR